MNDRMMYCINHTIGVEGVWSCSKSDRGRETVYGISRRQHPNAAVWKLVDAIAVKFKRGSAAFKKAVAASPDIRAAAVDFYKKEIWPPSRASVLPEPSDFFYYDLYVNSGPSGAAKIAARVADALGYFGVHVIDFLKSYEDTEKVGLTFLTERKRFYQQIVEHDSSQKANFLGWMNRLRKISTEAYGQPPDFLDRRLDNDP